MHVSEELMYKPGVPLHMFACGVSHKHKYLYNRLYVSTLVDIPLLIAHELIRKYLKNVNRTSQSLVSEFSEQPTFMCYWYGKPVAITPIQGLSNSDLAQRISYCPHSASVSTVCSKHGK